MMTWWAIAAGLMVEWPVVKRLTRRDWMGSLWPNLAINAVSSVLGIVLIPLGGFVWELIPEFTIYRWLGLGTFNPFGLLFGANMVSVGLAMASILLSPPQT